MCDWHVSGKVTGSTCHWVWVNIRVFIRPCSEWNPAIPGPQNWDARLLLPLDVGSRSSGVGWTSAAGVPGSPEGGRQTVGRLSLRDTCEPVPVISLAVCANLSPVTSVSLGTLSRTAGVLVCWDPHNTTPQTGGLKQQKFDFSPFWRPDVQDRGVGRAGFSGGLSLWLVDSRLLMWPLSSLCVAPGGSLHVHISAASKHTVSLEQDSRQWPHFVLVTSLSPCLQIDSRA